MGGWQNGVCGGNDPGPKPNPVIFVKDLATSAGRTHGVVHDRNSLRYRTQQRNCRLLED
jgi:hypothetical protein